MREGGSASRSVGLLREGGHTSNRQKLCKKTQAELKLTHGTPGTSSACAAALFAPLMAPAWHETLLDLWPSVYDEVAVTMLVGGVASLVSCILSSSST